MKKPTGEKEGKNGMKQYHELLQHVLVHGRPKGDRTGTGTLSTFGYQTRYDLSEGFPLVTTKDMITPNNQGVSRLDQIIEELLWFLRGETNIRPLVLKGVNIWNRDAYKAYMNDWEGTDKELTYKEFVELIRTDELFAQSFGDLGRVYGAQWRSWRTEDGEEIDQIQDAINLLINDPDSRRIIITAWNPGDNRNVVLPACHSFFQLYTVEGKVSGMLTQRSGDGFLGVPFNIASYSLLIMLIAQLTGLKPGEFIHSFGDLHIYNNHIEQVKEQLTREPYPLPTMHINPFVRSIDGFTRDDFELEDYKCHPELKGEQSS